MLISFFKYIETVLLPKYVGLSAFVYLQKMLIWLLITVLSIKIYVCKYIYLYLSILKLLNGINTIRKFYPGRNRAMKPVVLKSYWSQKVTRYFSINATIKCKQKWTYINISKSINFLLLDLTIYFRVHPIAKFVCCNVLSESYKM